MAPTTGVSHRQWVSGRVFKQQTPLSMGLPTWDVGKLSEKTGKACKSFAFGS